MLTLFHSPRTRSTRIVALIEELGAQKDVTIEHVGIPRPDGSAGPDPRNPHPEGKVPLLVHDDAVIWESSAIALYLTELFPDAGLGRPFGAPDRGTLLSWLAWYGDVMEPVVVLKYAELEHPILHATFRGLDQMNARLSNALRHSPYLMGESYSVADLICASTFHFAPQFLPQDDAVRAWADRCADRPAQRNAQAFDAKLLEAR